MSNNRTIKKVVVCITTFNRVDCARINMEIIKLNYPHPWPIVHACSDKNYVKYLEDFLVKRDSKPLQAGAFDLLKSSFQEAINQFSPDYLVHVEADTWLMNQSVIENYIEALENNPKAIIASSRWDFDKTYKWKRSSNPLKRVFYLLTKITKPLGLTWHIGWKNTIATQFFIVKNTSEFQEFLKSIHEPPANSYLEKYLFQEIKNRFGIKAFIIMQERTPVHPYNRDSCIALELYSQHFPTSENGDGKKQTLAKYKLFNHGPYMKKLLKSKNLDYYNGSAKRR